MLVHAVSSIWRMCRLVLRFLDQLFGLLCTKIVHHICGAILSYFWHSKVTEPHNKCVCAVAKMRQKTAHFTTEFTLVNVACKYWPLYVQLFSLNNSHMRSEDLFELLEDWFEGGVIRTQTYYTM